MKKINWTEKTKKATVFIFLIVIVLVLLLAVFFHTNTTPTPIGQDNLVQNKTIKPPDFYSEISVPQTFISSTSQNFDSSEAKGYVQTFTSNDGNLKVVVNVITKKYTPTKNTGLQSFLTPDSRLLSSLKQTETVSNIPLYREDENNKYNLAITDSSIVDFENYVSFNMFAKTENANFPYENTFQTQSNYEVTVTGYVKLTTQDLFSKNVILFDNIVKSLKI